MIAQNTAIRLLVIEDNPGDVRLIKEALRKFHAGFDVVAAGSMKEALGLLREQAFDTILLDLNLPDSMGIDTVSKVFARAPRTPIIVLTGFHDESISTQAISVGAQDYLVKENFSPELLSRSIQYAGQRKKIEKALQESEARYKSLFDTSLDCIFQVDNKGAIVMVNPAGAEMFGFSSPEAAIGTYGFELWEDHAERSKFFDTIRSQKILRGYPVKARKKSGEIIHLEVSCHVLEDEQGNSTGIEGILRDITERKVLEEQLLQSQKIEAVGTLAGGVAHDFNNILTAIIGYTRVALMKLGHDDPLHYELQQVIAAADRAAMLTQSLLAFSRKQLLHLAPIELAGVIGAFSDFIHRLVREDIEIETRISDEKMVIMADKGQIEQALMNLVTNAQDAMPNGGQLVLECKQEVIDEAFILAHGYGKKGVYALVSVSDNGIGMDEQTRQKIFDPFFTTKEVGKGTGLGLALVYGTVKKHDGFITVSSEPGKGATFRLYFPLTDQLPEKPAGPLDASLQAVVLSEGTETILVAEDDEALRTLAVNVLENAGYEVIEARDGMEAIQKVMEYKDRIGLALLDVIMPKKNGPEVYREIMAQAPGLKVIFMSGYTEGAFDLSDAQTKKVVFLQKPISPNEMLRRIRAELDRDKQPG